MSITYVRGRCNDSAIKHGLCPEELVAAYSSIRKGAGVACVGGVAGTGRDDVVKSVAGLSVLRPNARSGEADDISGVEAARQVVRLTVRWHCALHEHGLL